MKVVTPSGLRPRSRVTVMIPCYNYGRFLPQAVQCALDQAHVEVDVVIVDDASTDGSADTARGLASRDPRVSLVQHERNQGHIRTYNDGLRASKGDYVTLVSADDLLARDALTRAVGLMETHPTVGLVYGPVRVFESEVPDEPMTSPTHWALWTGHEWARSMFGHGRNVIRSPEAVVRRDLLDQVGLYDEAHPHAGDLQMWLRLAATCDVGFVAGTVQAHYRQHAQNMHSTVFGTDMAWGMVTDLRHRLAAFETAAPCYPHGSELARAARSSLAREAVDLASRAYVWGLTSRWPVDELLGFARECDPDVLTTRPARAFRRRRRVGTRLARKNPAFVLRELALRRAERHLDVETAQFGLPQPSGARS